MRRFSTQLKPVKPTSVAPQTERLLAALPYSSRKQEKPSSWMHRLFPNRVLSKLSAPDTLAKLFPPQPKFIPLESSPHASLRELHNDCVQYSSCPVCLSLHDKLPEEEWDSMQAIPGGTSRQTVGPKSRLRPSYTCPESGWPTHCSREHWEEDAKHQELIPALRQWIEDEHDAKCSRRHWEMAFPGRQNPEDVLNFTGWPHLLATRKFPKSVLQHPIAQRHISRYLTYPYTLASLLYTPWTYLDEQKETSDRAVTDAGWHLLSSLSHAVATASKAAVQQSKQKTKGRKVSFTPEPTSPLHTADPFRIFVLGPRIECRLPSSVWEQLSLTFPGVPFRVFFIGPESQPPQQPITAQHPGSVKHRALLPAIRLHERELTKSDDTKTTSFIASIGVNLRMEFMSVPYETVHESLGPFNRRRDIFVMFHSGIGHPATREQWRPALEQVLKTRCLTVMTSLNELDQQADVEAFQQDYEGQYAVVLKPTANKFSSMRMDVPVDSVHSSEHWVRGNSHLFAVHGVGTDVDVPSEGEVYEMPAKSWWSW